MLHDRTFHGNELEHAAVDAILELHTPYTRASVTRTEPDETGPLRLEIDGQAWLISPQGDSQPIEEA